MNANDQINSWEDLDKEIESLFNTPDSLASRVFKVAYQPLKDIVCELKNNQEKYRHSPDQFSDFVFHNPSYAKNLFDWLPYLSGARAKLVEMKFLDSNKNEIIDKEQIRQLIKDNDPEVTSTTYIVIYPDFNRIDELNSASAEINNDSKDSLVYADINRPAYNMKNIQKKLK